MGSHAWRKPQVSHSVVVPERHIALPTGTAPKGQWRREECLLPKAIAAATRPTSTRRALQRPRVLRPAAVPRHFKFDALRLGVGLGVVWPIPLQALASSRKSALLGGGLASFFFRPSFGSCVEVVVLIPGDHVQNEVLHGHCFAGPTVRGPCNGTHLCAPSFSV